MSNTKPDLSTPRPEPSIFKSASAVSRTCLTQTMTSKPFHLKQHARINKPFSYNLYPKTPVNSTSTTIKDPLGQTKDHKRHKAHVCFARACARNFFSEGQGFQTLNSTTQPYSDGGENSLAKSELRIQYSGLIIFAAQLISVATGFGFILLLTRSTTTDEYGVWSNIFDVTGYFVLFSGLVPFWATRFVARAKEGAARTALLANFVIGLAAAAVYISLVPSITAGLHINNSYVPVYLLASAQLTTVFLVSLLESCLRARKPQAIGYGLLVEESCKLGLAFVLIVLLHQFFATAAALFVAAMLSLIVSASVQALYYVRLLRGELQFRMRWNYVKEWLKGSTVILYNAVGNQLGTYVLIILFVFGSETARGDYQASATFAAIIGYSFSLAFALYPKLLAEDSLHEVTMSLRTVLLFALPMAALVIATSQSLLTVLKVDYSDAWPVLIALSVDAVAALIIQFYTSVL